LRHRRRALHGRDEAHALGLGGVPRGQEGVPHETQFGEVDGRRFDHRGIGKAIVLGLGAVDRRL
jgi:hypothetical protein